MPRPVRFVLSSLWIACTLAFAAPVWAVDFNDFACITNDDAGDCAIGESQLSASIVAAGEDAILTLTMSGPDDAVVEQLFIESTIVSDIRFEGSVGVGVVAFGSGEHGGNLPGGNEIGFLEAFTIGAKEPPPLNGIGRHEQDDTSAQSADFLLSLEGGDFDDFIADLRIGVHVIGYDSNGSESFVSTPVPEPSTLVLVGLGLALATRRRASGDLRSERPHR